MSSAFDVTPAPAAADGLDFEYDDSPQTERKFHCDAGTYNAVVKELKKFPKKDADGYDRLLLKVVLVDDGVKGIQASRFYDLGGQYAFVLEKAVEAFGITPEVTEVDGKKRKRLPLRENYTKIFGASCRVQVKPRQVGDRVFMDVERIFTAAPAASDSADIPF